jgi:transcription antitermination factor NusG
MMDGAMLAPSTLRQATWFVAVVLTGHERAVKMRIDELGQPIETFLPLVETQAYMPAKPATRHRPARPAIAQICVPMFGGYLFISVDPDDPTVDWERMREIRGYGRMLTNAYGRPVPARGLGPLLDRADKDGLIAPDALDELLGRHRPGKHIFAEGELVRVEMGRFSGYNGIFVEYRREGSLVEINGIPVHVLTEHLAPV